jgi:hypothetical protein
MTNQYCTIFIFCAEISSNIILNFRTIEVKSYRSIHRALAFHTYVQALPTLG